MNRDTAHEEIIDLLAEISGIPKWCMSIEIGSLLRCTINNRIYEVVSCPKLFRRGVLVIPVKSIGGGVTIGMSAQFVRPVDPLSALGDQS